MKVRKDVSLQLNDLCSNSITEEKQIIRVFYDLSFKSSNLDFLFFALFPIQRCLYILSQTMENLFSQYPLSKNTKRIL